MNRSRPLVCLLAVALGPLLLVGCGTYRSGFEYQPRPASRQIPPDAAEPDARVLASVIGIRRDARDVPHANTIEVRLRVEATGERPVELLPESLSLVSADLKLLGAPTVEPGDPPAVEPGDRQLVTAYFPIADEPETDGGGELDVAGLNLRFAVMVGRQRHVQSISFELREREYREYPRYHIGVGYHPAYYHHAPYW